MPQGKGIGVEPLEEVLAEKNVVIETVFEH
jgi:hypothetical protein